MGVTSIPESVFIHETAIVEPGCTIGERSQVWHHVHIRSGASVGADTNLGKNVYLDSGAVVGSGCKVQNNVSIYRGVVLQDGVFVGPSAVFTNDLFPRAGNTEWTLVPTVVEEGATIGANATIVCGVKLGRFALVAAGAVVTKDVVAQELVGGNPARRLGWVCRCGRPVAKGNAPLLPTVCEACGAQNPIEL
jgi:acetyltransferase-like isoleucine patch superfamily enzyme